MMYKSHLAVAFLFALLSFYFITVSNKLIFISLALFACLIPDLDHADSKLGRRFRFISYPIQFVFGHRGFLHSLLFSISFSFLMLFLIKIKIYSIAVLIGLLSHLFADMLTVSGVPLFYPLTKKRFKGFIETNSLLEMIVFLFVLAIDVLLVKIKIIR